MEHLDTPNEAWTDPIVAEVRAVREALLADVGYDLHELAQRLHEHRASIGARVVARPKRVAQRSGEEKGKS